MALSSSAVWLAGASAVLAPVLASGGLWVARATDPRLARRSAALRPSSIVLASGLALAMAPEVSPAALAGYWVCACLAAAAAADRDQLVLPDILTLAAAILGLAFRPFAPSESRIELLAVGVGLYIVGNVFAWAMRAWRGRAALGQGDVKLIAGLGMILPVGLIGPAILAGAVSALLWTRLPARVPRRGIALGLHLVVGATVALGATMAIPTLLGR